MFPYDFCFRDSVVPTRAPLGVLRVCNTLVQLLHGRTCRHSPNHEMRLWSQMARAKQKRHATLVAGVERGWLNRSKVDYSANARLQFAAAFRVVSFANQRNRIRTTSARVPNLIGGPQVPAPLVVYTSMRLN